MALFLAEVAAGAVCGYATVAAVKQRCHSVRAVRAALALVLFLAAVVYVSFQLVGEAALTLTAPGSVFRALEPTSSIGVELVGCLLYGAIGAAGVWAQSSRVVASGWVAHVAWDTVAHTAWFNGVANPSPDWYPAVCIGYDLIVAYQLFVL